MKNSVTCNLPILDEVFSVSLDEVGKEYLLHILRFQLENTNVIVVDHTLSGAFKDKFDRQIEVTRLLASRNMNNKKGAQGPLF